MALAQALCVCAALAASPGAAAKISSARYSDPTTRYAHGVLGDDVEFATLAVTLDDGSRQSATWPPGMIFEDTAPRLVDLTGDGTPEVITVESSDILGARLAVWGLDPNARLVPLVASPPIGHRFRWLSPLGAADLDGDGTMEIAWIDRPHLAKTLQVWRFAAHGDQRFSLTPVASLTGLTNHRIGENDIAGGIRDCGQGPELITADADWRNVMATRLNNATLSTRSIAPHTDRSSFIKTMSCQ
ncbi:FG-GAP repeat domain-containing protein [Oceaniglobus ichthyenteri]|uniref:FG-GAP repeat domain-containing protein n=1 Tax=Oceaniglobus ichthyenteri TaxID=2136177 RepID=UPI001F0C6C35|nr:VCBS repeat-containing protein [Oceaniglobus ichthyenteri]